MSKYLTPTTIGGAVAAALLAALLAVLWPPGALVGTLLAMLLGMVAVALAIHIAARRRYRPDWDFRPGNHAELTDAELAEWRNRALIEREQRLELRELQIARQMRALQIANENYLDVLESEPSPEELAVLVETDRKLIALIENEAQIAFDNILKNRYGAPDGVDTVLILADLRGFVERVALLYRPDTENPLLESEIERIAKTLSSTALHLLVVIDGLPINLKSYNTAKMYRLLRRSAKYYGAYKSYRPYIQHGFDIVNAARLAFSLNPAAAGAAWAAGRLTAYGARALGERVLQRRALQLLHDFVRVIGFEAAMMYGGDFRYRDANWVFGAALVNLEVSRGGDLRGRDAALVNICNLALRHEFDRIRLVKDLARGRPIELRPNRTRILLTAKESRDCAALLAKHCRETEIDTSTQSFAAWREATESVLGVPLDLPATPARKPQGLLRRWLRRPRPGKDEPRDAAGT